MNKQKTLTGVTVKDAEKGAVEAVFSTFNVVDSDGDITLPGAIKDGMEVVISAYGHQSHGGALPVGKGVIATTKNEAILKGQFFMNTAGGRDTFEVVKELGPLGEWSYSLHNVKSRQGELDDGRTVNYLEEIGLIKEVSPVLLGAGVNTRTLVAKGLKFSEEGDAVLAAVDAYLGRAQEVMVLRAAKGRELSPESAALLEQIDEELVKLRAVLEAKSEPTGDDEDQTPEDIKTLAAEQRRLDLFSNLNQIGEAS